MTPLQAALKRIGSEIAKESIKEKDATLYVRVNPEHGSAWVEMLTNLLLTTGKKPYTFDVSKYFFASQGDLKYLWRFFITGDVEQAIAYLTGCVQEASMNHVRQFDSFPLVGRAQYEFNPAKGKLKGGHSIDEAPVILGAAIGAAQVPP